MNEKLKECPFCGSTDLYERGNYIECGRCSAYGPSVSSENGATMAEAWNRRTECGSVVVRISLDEDKLRQIADEAMKNVAAEYAQPVKEALKSLEYYGERGEPMPAYVCRELADDMKAAGDD